MDTTEPKLEESLSPLMKLPPELRCKVYRYLLVLPVGISVHYGTMECYTWALFAVSPTINNEATAIFYGENQFIWNNWQFGMADYLRINPRFVPLLRAVVIDCTNFYHGMDKNLVKLLAEFSGPDVQLGDFVLRWTSSYSFASANDPVVKALKSLKGIKRFCIELPSEHEMEVGLEDELRANLETTGLVEGRTFEVTYREKKEPGTPIWGSRGFHDDDYYYDMIQDMTDEDMPDFEYFIESESDQFPEHDGQPSVVKAGQNDKVTDVEGDEDGEDDTSRAKGEDSEVEKKLHSTAYGIDTGDGEGDEGCGGNEESKQSEEEPNMEH
ncbi:MAG: hypothetical protein M1836_008099 [Candelina mexicana]|nr:MAG: hypothetical protein M1836_008099 [Candelina mexicana]